MPAPDLDRFSSRRSTVYGSRGVVATSQPLAAEAGVELLRTGGNAFDAAVATAAALNVVEPMSTGLGGDVFALYRTADGDVGALRSCGGAPAAATLDAVREAVGGESDDGASMPFRGPHTVTVPGTARGWETTVDELGRLTLAECLAPAVRYATEGYPVSEVIAAQWDHGEDLFEDDARDAFLFDGHAPDVGQQIRLPALGRTLERIGEAGADVVYEGDVGEAIVDAVRSKGGFLSMDDLAAFEPEFVDPVSTTYNGCEVYELPPNNQGLVALEALNVASEVGAPEAEGVERLHLLAEATKLAFHDGHRYITDPDHEEMPPLNSRSWARQRATRIGPEATGDVSFLPRSRAEDADTVLLCVADDAGNVVSYINSLFAGFGSGLVAGETGIALQNRGASFSLDPDHPNRLAPGKRPFHTLIPGLLDFAPDDARDDWAAFGVMGGFMQPQGHVQVVSNLADRDLPVQRALDEPRWRYREDGTLAVEERLPGATKLARRGHDVRVLPPGQFGGAQLARNDDGTLSGATEPRKDGTVAPY
ncbi:gamma-glutamyltransferase family protein [Salinigranum marinum]|uniref:gamma-glutamyltransferase family protein n=1 Tax=Salinigranum marinum TaxID=1515595 RepID=UPI002989E617|nr:gamma-glutamyltransferase family protein [Salinigranum marinum]